MDFLKKTDFLWISQQKTFIAFYSKIFLQLLFSYWLSFFLLIYSAMPFSVVWFYGISTIVGYLMPNPVYKYIWFLSFRVFELLSSLLLYS